MVQLTPLLDTRSITLDKLPISIQHLDDKIGLVLRSSVELERYNHQVLDAMVWKLNAIVLAEKIVEKTIAKSHTFEHKVRYPRSWWQHFKQDVLNRTWVTRWIVRWKPVLLHTEYKYESVTLGADFTQYAKYPAADLVLAPESVHKGHIVVHEELTPYWRAPSA